MSYHVDLDLTLDLNACIVDRWRATERRLHFDSPTGSCADSCINDGYCIRLLVWIRRVRPVFPFPKLNSALKYARDDRQWRISIVDLTARVPGRFFTFAEHVSFEHSEGTYRPLITSGRKGNTRRFRLPSLHILQVRCKF